jgi:hypothetical protein
MPRSPLGEIAYQPEPSTGERRCQTNPPVCNRCWRVLTLQHFGCATVVGEVPYSGRLEFIACTACTTMRDRGPAVTLFWARHQAFEIALAQPPFPGPSPQGTPEALPSPILRRLSSRPWPSSNLPAAARAGQPFALCSSAAGGSRWRGAKRARSGACPSGSRVAGYGRWTRPFAFPLLASEAELI